VSDERWAVSKWRLMWDGDGTKMRGKACESFGTCVIAYGKFQPSGISESGVELVSFLPWPPPTDRRRLTNKIAYAPLCRLVCKFDPLYLSIIWLIWIGFSFLPSFAARSASLCYGSNSISKDVFFHVQTYHSRLNICYLNLSELICESSWSPLH
jgi:hypothetical protein